MKTASKLLILLLAALLLCGCAAVPGESTSGNPAPSTQAPTEAGETTAPTEPEATEILYPYDYTSAAFFQIEDCLKFAPKASLVGIDGNKKPFNILATEDGYTVAQGAACDGTYGYFLQANTSAVINGEITEACRLIKVDLSSWEIVEMSEPLLVEHGNGLTYNSKTHKLVAAHCSPNPRQLSIINADTLQVEQVVELKRNVQSIAYNAKRDQYVVRMSGRWNFAILDADFQEISYHETGIETPLGSQNSFCDDDYIYMLDSGVVDMPGMECFTVYDWDGNYQGVYRVSSVQETEAIFLYNGEYYITFYNGSGTRVYKMEFDKTLLGNYRPY